MWCAPLSTVSCAGVVEPLSLPSTQTLAPCGLLVTTSVDTVGVNSAVTSRLLPVCDSIMRVTGRYPTLVKTSVWFPAARCDAVNGVIQLGSLQPSISTFAPSGVENNFNSLCWTNTLFGELVAFTGVGSFDVFSCAFFRAGKNFTVVSGAMTSLLTGTGVGSGMAIATGCCCSAIN